MSICTPSKALSPILFILSGIIDALHALIILLLFVSTIELQLFLLSYFLFALLTLIDVREKSDVVMAPFMFVTEAGIYRLFSSSHRENAPTPITDKFSDSVILSSLAQFVKTPLPISVTLCGKTTSSILQL